MSNAPGSETKTAVTNVTFESASLPKVSPCIAAKNQVDCLGNSAQLQSLKPNLCGSKLYFTYLNKQMGKVIIQPMKVNMLVHAQFFFFKRKEIYNFSQQPVRLLDLTPTVK